MEGAAGSDVISALETTPNVDLARGIVLGGKQGD